MSTKKLTGLEQLEQISIDAQDDPKVKSVADLAVSIIKTLQTENGNQAVALETAANEVIGLQEIIGKLSTGKKVKPAFSYKKEKWQADHAVNLDGVVYSPVQIAESPGVQKKLIEGLSSAVSRIPDPEESTD